MDELVVGKDGLDVGLGRVPTRSKNPRLGLACWGGGVPTRACVDAIEGLASRGSGAAADFSSPQPRTEATQSFGLTLLTQKWMSLRVRTCLSGA
jgi:hypothetical protein